MDRVGAELRLREARLDQHDADAEAAHLVIERLRQALEGMLAAGVEPHERPRQETQNGARVHDRAGALAAHRGKDGPHHAQDTEHVRVEERLGLARARLLDGADDGVAGIVDQHVDSAGLTENGLDAGRHRGVVPYVERQQLDALDRGHCVRVAGGAEHAIAAARQELGRGAADAGGGAGDQDDFLVGHGLVSTSMADAAFAR